ncbi:MAG: Stk1 family PASTA domain-containing Ser/Thr kinase [Acidimicrobiia bacterium]|nr:Stk1 family PASTA domain-containing Ser/Thr kinase [Acidimicrobiia bacterium]
MPQPTVFSGRYELHRRLGRGGMAEVFLARDLQLDRPVAVKVLFAEFATDPSFVARFRREAQAAANLNHPNIVSVYDWGQEHGTYFIVMEYVDGPSLADMIRADGPIPADRAVDIGTDVAAALSHAHTGGMLHRDIKPGNILVTEAGIVKVADWGIGRAMDAAAEENLTQAGSVMGTATYFSPEQAQGLSLDPRSDLYSLGVVLYEMVTARAPFQGDSPVAIAYKHVQEQPRPPRSLNLAVPAALEAIILLLLEKDPARRYASAEDLRADLRRYREGFTVMATQAAPAVAGTQVVPVVQPTAVVGVPVEDLPREYVPATRERRSGLFLVALVVLLAVLAGLLFLLARTLGVGEDQEPEVVQVEVPVLAGQGIIEEDARNLLQAQSCENTEADGTITRVSCFTVGATQFEQVDDPALIGIVVGQDPGGGERVDQGSTITLTVGEANLLVVPDVAGSLVDDATRQLQERGFVGEISQREEPSEDVDAGQVVRTEPAADQEAPSNGPIVLVVSSGPSPVGVPPCESIQENECVNDVQEAGLVPRVIGEASNDVEQGRVIRTEPGPGTEVPAGGEVVIVVSSGAATATVPPVVGLDQDAAVNALEDAGFGADVQTQPVDPGSDDAGRVIDQTPGGNEEAEPGSTVTIVVGEATEAPPATDVGD